MFSALFVTLALGAAPQQVESCAFVENQSSPTNVQAAQLYGAQLADWKKRICAGLLPGFSDVEFSVLSRSHTGGLNKNARGALSISPLKAGRVKVVWDAGNHGKQTYWLKVVAKQEVWVFKSRMKKLDRVTTRDVDRELIDVASMIGIKEIVNISPVGKVVTRQVRGGDVITQGLIAEPPLISRQDEITVFAKTGALSIVTKGVALDTAWKEGEMLQVKVHGATEAVRAIVTGEKQAYVEI